MKTFDALAAGFVTVAIIAVVLSKGSATTNFVSTAFSALTSMIRLTMNPLATGKPGK
jgi:hypothetical protein